MLPARWRSQDVAMAVLFALALDFVLRITTRQSRDGSTIRTVLKTTQGAAARGLTPKEGELAALGLSPAKAAYTGRRAGYAPITPPIWPALTREFVSPGSCGTIPFNTPPQNDTV